MKDYRATYEAELDKLEKLEYHYWRCWAECDQAERRNLKYLDGVRWCMTHRLKLLTKLERLPVQAPAPAAADWPVAPQQPAAKPRPEEPLANEDRTGARQVLTDPEGSG